MRSMIRWPGLGIFAVSILTICIVSIFFIDSIIERLIEDQGTDLNGARVDLEKANVSFFPAGLELQGLQVTNPDEPMQNIVAIDRIACSIDLMKLIQRKVIIDEMAVEGIRPNTPRNVSGAISKTSSTDSPRKNETTGPKAEEKSTRAASLNLPDAREVLAKEELTTLTLSKEYQEQLETDKAIWQQKLNELPDKDKFTDYKKRIKQLSSGGVMTILKNGPKLKALRKEIRGDIKGIKAANKELDQLTNSYKKRLSELKEAPQQDIDRLTDKYALTGTGLANMSDLLFGANVGNRIDQTLSWYAKAQPLIEGAKQNVAGDKTVNIPRSKGLDVRFQEHTPLPDFLIHNLTASVVTAQGDLVGTINNLTPDQDVLRLPLTFSFQGVSLKGLGSISIDGILDHIDPARASDSFKLELSDYAISKPALSAAQPSAMELNGGFIDISANGNIRQQKIEATIDAKIKKATFTSVSHGDITSKTIANTLAGITEFNAKAIIGGSLDDYKVTLSSDLDKILQQALASSLKAEAKRFKGELRTLIIEQSHSALSETESQFKSIDSISEELRDRLKIGDKLL